MDWWPLIFKVFLQEFLLFPFPRCFGCDCYPNSLKDEHFKDLTPRKLINHYFDLVMKPPNFYSDSIKALQLLPSLISGKAASFKHRLKLIYWPVSSTYSFHFLLFLIRCFLLLPWVMALIKRFKLFQCSVMVNLNLIKIIVQFLFVLFKACD